MKKRQAHSQAAAVGSVAELSAHNRQAHPTEAAAASKAELSMVGQQSAVAGSSGTKPTDNSMRGRIARFAGGMVVQLGGARLQLSDRQLEVLRIIAQAAKEPWGLSARERIHEAFWGLPPWSARPQTGRRATNAQRASLSRTLRRLVEHGLVQYEPAYDWNFEKLELTECGREVLAALGNAVSGQMAADGIENGPGRSGAR